MDTKSVLSAIPRVLLGLLSAWGGILHFTVKVADWQNIFLSSLYETGYLWQIIGVINLAAGILLVVNRFTVLSLLALLPITFNIFLFHIFYFTIDGLFIGIPMFLLNLWCIWHNRTHYKVLMQFKLNV
jgi:hypothetical protein